MSKITRVNKKITKENIMCKEFNIVPDEIIVYQDEWNVQAAALITGRKENIHNNKKKCVSVHPEGVSIKKRTIVFEKNRHIKYDRSHLIPNYYIDNCSREVLILWNSASNQGYKERSIKDFEERIDKRIKDKELAYPFYWFTSIERQNNYYANWNSCILKEGLVQKDYVYFEMSEDPYAWF